MNENKKNYLWFLILFAILIFSVYMFWQSYNVPDNGGAVDDVRKQLRDAGERFDNAQKHVGNIENELDGIEERINQGKSGIDRSVEFHTNNEKRIAEAERGIASIEDSLRESQSIIQTVRRTGEKNKEKTD